MATLRAFLLANRRFAALLLALALCFKVMVPAGYMLGGGAKVLTIEICADASGGKITKQIVVPHSGKPADPAKSDACPYAGHATAGLPGADAQLLALALAFILALGFAPTRSAPPRRIFQLRPPLRGPPALA